MLLQLLDQTLGQKAERQVEKVDKATKVKAITSAHLVQELTASCNELQDKIKDEQNVVHELEEKEEEYDNMIGFTKEEYKKNQ